MAARQPRGKTLLDSFSKAKQDADLRERLQSVTAIAAKLHEDARGFRFHAASTQKRQDRILHQYREFAKFANNIPDDAPQDVVDSICFPHPTPARQWDELIDLCDVLVFWAVYQFRNDPEGHHFAWLLARCCALRPGSIGSPHAHVDDLPKTLNGGPPYLAWRDVKISRGAAPYEFDLTISIRNLKDTTYLKNIESGTTTLPKGSKSFTMDFHFKSAMHQANLAFAPVIRLLVIALRRKALVGIQTVDELLSGQSLNIDIEPAFFDKPIVLAGTQRGLGVSSDKAAQSKSLSEYLTKRATSAGYSVDAGITFYSLRRSAAGSLYEAYGTEVARQVMGHDSESRILERCYLDMRQGIDLTAVGLGEDTNQRQDELLAIRNANALTRLDAETIAKFVNPAADALFHRLLFTDDVIPTLSRSSEIKNRKRCLRRIALDAARNQIEEEHAVKITTGDIEKRKQDIVNRMDMFTQQLVRRAADAIAAQGLRTFSLMDTSGPDPDEDLSRESGDQDCQPEPDAEELFVRDGRIQSIVEEVNYGDVAAEIPYGDAVKHVLEMLLDQDSITETPELFCQLCQDDDTVSQELKDRTWPSKAKLSIHQNTKFHTGFSTWERRAKAVRAKNGTQGFCCEICVAIAPAEFAMAQFTTMSNLVQHMDQSTDETIEGNPTWSTPSRCQEHANLKQELGWNNEDFRGNQELKRYRQYERLHTLKKRGLVFEKLEELHESCDFPGNPHVVLGGPSRPYPGLHPQMGFALPMTPVGDILSPCMTPGNASSLIELIPLSTSLTSMQSTAQQNLFEQHVDIVESVLPPGAEGNMPQDGLRIKDQLMRRK
ncbi:hypothetical protein CDEST_08728 [Colletotrichum destructivum]|uniref:FluG domain-containing protein n=1 Tax=Colletotrichum destructivum TaxID=34406 RepID=A0AAX4IK72_9PEZI|nr:hypothetical protein CDEST_08728 [Colletotrichum destructivum]